MAIGRIPEPLAGIQESILDAKGDLVTATAADTPARLAVGTNNQTLVADSTQSTGLKYANGSIATLTAKGDLLTATAANTIARLGVGANGTTLVADSSEATGLKWATPAAGGGMTLLSTTTLSGASTTISVSATGYENLFVQVTGVNQSDSGAFRLAINGDTNLTQSLQYLNYTAGVQGADGYNSDRYTSHSCKSGNTNNVYTYNIYNVTSTTSYKTILSIFGYVDGSDRNAMDWGGGFYRSNNAVTSLVFSPNSGTFSAGTVKVYGVK